jgi:NAD(P)-dependent dehydrogenase (short-subunit alcohol dehydrogenase family)
MDVHVLQLNVSLLSSVRHFAEQWAGKDGSEKKIDILIHNAGMPSPPADSDTTSEGLNAIYATNFLGSFLLTSLLEPHLASGARVIFTSSIASYLGTFSTRQQLAPSQDYIRKKNPAPSMLYAYTKLDQIAFARLLQARFDMSHSPGQARRTAHAFSPGYSATTLFDRIPSTAWYLDIWFWFIKLSTKLATPIKQGAATGLWLATTDDHAVIGQGGGGGYWERLTRRTTTVDWRGGKSLQRLWDAWCRDSGASWQ